MIKKQNKKISQYDISALSQNNFWYMQHNIQPMNLVFLLIIWPFICPLCFGVAWKRFYEFEQFFL